MTFKEFKIWIEESIKDLLAKCNMDAAVASTEITTSSETYIGLYIRSSDQSFFPVANLNDAYQRYQSGISKGQLIYEILNICALKAPEIPFTSPISYEEAQNRLYVKVVSRAAKIEKLSDRPYTKIEDMILTYHIQADRSEKTSSSIIITNQILDSWGITKERLHRDAIENTMRLYPLNYMPLTDVLPFPVEDGFPNLKVVTNKNMYNGAAALFYPGMMERIAEDMETGFYVLPSSIHEVLVISDEAPVSIKELNQMVVSVNTSMVNPREQLADHIYHYDRDSKTFESVLAA